MSDKKSPKIDSTIDLIADLMYEAGFYSVSGHFGVSHNCFKELVEYSLMTGRNGFDEYRFICSIENDIQAFYECDSFVYNEEYLQKISDYLNSGMVHCPSDHEYVEKFHQDALYRLKMVNSYERRRRVANSYLASYKNRKRIFDKLGRVCRICGATEKLSIDHILPVIKGGGNEDENLQILCSSCNSSKGSK